MKWSEWVSEVSEWVKWKWWVFGPLFFLKLIYIIDHVYTYNPICVKICSQLSYGFKSLQTFGDPTKKNQNHHFYMIFFNRAKSLKHRRWEAFFVKSAAKPPTPGRSADQAAYSADIRCTQAAVLEPRRRPPPPCSAGTRKGSGCEVKWSEWKWWVFGPLNSLKICEHEVFR